MATFGDGEVYEKLGLRPFINASSQGSAIGGRPAPAAVHEALISAGTLYVEMGELLEAAGCRIASLLGVEAAYPTPGCAAAVMFSTAGCMSMDDPEKAISEPASGEESGA